MSMTMKSQIKMKKSIFAVGNNLNIKQKRNKCKKMSIARQSIFRTCEPAIGLNDNKLFAQKEAVRRATAISKSRASVFMMS